jgi:quercetin dioxygenase-like cupin family protein
MTIDRTAILIAIFLLFPLNAFSLDQSVAVKQTNILKTTNSWDGKPIVYPDGKAEITGLLVEIAPGAETGWHLHPVPSFGMVLDGTLEVTLKDGSLKRLQAGDALAEVVNTPHKGHNVGNIPVRLIVFYAGTVGQAISIK